MFSQIRGRYVIRKPFSFTNFALMWLGIIGILAAVAFLAVTLEIGMGSVLVLALPLPVAWYSSSRVLLVVDRSGARVERTGRPWDQIAQVVLRPLPQATPPAFEVGLRLEQDTGGGQAAPETSFPRVTVPADELDQARLVDTVRRFAPTVPVVEQVGAGERVLT